MSTKKEQVPVQQPPVQAPAQTPMQMLDVGKMQKDLQRFSMIAKRAEKTEKKLVDQFSATNLKLIRTETVVEELQEALKNMQAESESIKKRLVYSANMLGYIAAKELVYMKEVEQAVDAHIRSIIVGPDSAENLKSFEEARDLFSQELASVKQEYVVLDNDNKSKDKTN